VEDEGQGGNTDNIYQPAAANIKIIGYIRLWSNFYDPVRQNNNEKLLHSLW